MSMEVPSNSQFKPTTTDGGRVSPIPSSACNYSEKLVYCLNEGILCLPLSFYDEANQIQDQWVRCAYREVYGMELHELGAGL